MIDQLERTPEGLTSQRYVYISRKPETKDQEDILVVKMATIFCLEMRFTHISQGQNKNPESFCRNKGFSAFSQEEKETTYM